MNELEEGMWFKYRDKDGRRITYFIPRLDRTHWEVVNEFTNFLKGCGYTIKGEYEEVIHESND